MNIPTLANSIEADLSTLSLRLSATEHPDLLVKTLKELIAEFEEDTSAKLAGFEKTFNEFAAARVDLSDGPWCSEYEKAARAMDCFETWKERTASLVFQSGDPQRLRREFVTQTAYLVVVRMLLVRIMEDKGLMPRAFTNGGLALWFQQVEPQYLALAAGRSAHYLLALSYESAQRVYAHFYQEKTVLDWYRPERTAVVRVLHRLASFDLRDIDRDIIGTVYNQYVEERHKHESGMYFTPPPVVEFMLDRVGYRGRGILERKLLDLSCGSGTFLVAAARRLLAAHRDYWQAQGYPDIPIEQAEPVIKDLRDALHGIDLNPFACALAEINLLIQVMDLINAGLKTGIPVHVERFHIYSDDSLSFTLATNSVLADGLSFPVEVLPVTDQIKAAIGEWSGGFDLAVFLTWIWISIKCLQGIDYK